MSDNEFTKMGGNTLQGRTSMLNKRDEFTDMKIGNDSQSFTPMNKEEQPPRKRVRKYSSFDNQLEDSILMNEPQISPNTTYGNLGDLSSASSFALDLVSDPIVFANRDQILYANRSFTRLTGFSANQIVGLSVSNNNTASQTFLKNTMDFFRIVQHYIDGKTVRRDVVIDCLDSNGETFYSRVSFNVSRSSGGDICICIFNDLYCKSNKESIFQTLFDNVNVGMGLIEYLEEERDIVYIASNRVIAEWCNLPNAEDINGKSARKDLFFPDATINTYINLYKEAELLKRPISKCVKVTHRNETELWIAATVCYIGKSMDGHSRFSYVMEDISERKLVEEELHLAESKALFLSNMSHELRTPLSAVIGMASVLHETQLSADQKECVESIQICADSLLNLINDILEFSKMQSQRLELAREEIDVGHLIEQSMEVVSGIAHMKHLELITSIKEDTQTHIIGDKHRISQILVNLLTNSIKFTEQGEVILRVSSRQIKDKCEYHFAIQDTGIGIDYASQSQLFKPFSQVDVSMTRRHGGAGLGLSISKRLVEMMGGKLWVESEGIGKGSTFHFTILTNYLPKKRSSCPELSLFENRNMFIIEKSKTLADSISTRLTNLGFRTWCFNSVTDAFNFQYSIQPDIVLHSLPTPYTEDWVKLKDKFPKAHFIHLGTMNPEKELRPFLKKPVRDSVLTELLFNLFDTSSQVLIHKEKDETAAFASNHPMSILIVEDNPMNQRVLVRLLESLGYDTSRIRIANNGKEGIEALERNMVDVVLLDIRMPVCDGIQATKIIREKWKQGKPFIISMTADAFKEDIEKCLNAGMDLFLSKPIRRDALAKALALFRP